MEALGLLSLIVPLLVIGGIVTIVVVAINRSRQQVRGTVSPRDIFISLLAAATLYISAIGVLSLIWGLAEYWFPDPYRGFDYSPTGGAVRVGISMAVVAFPIFVYLSLLSRRRVAAGELDPSSVLRNGFIYFNLFVVAITSMVTLMVTVNAFLGGDLTPRFLIRAGGVLGIVALVYLYYRSELGAGAGKSGKKDDQVLTGKQDPEVSQ